MKYIQSFTEYESTVVGFDIPKGRYSMNEQNMGKKNIVAIEDCRLEEISKNIIFKQMVDAGKLVIHDALPEQYVGAAEKVKMLEEENRKLKAYIKKNKLNIKE